MVEAEQPVGRPATAQRSYANHAGQDKTLVFYTGDYQVGQ